MNAFGGLITAILSVFLAACGGGGASGSSGIDSATSAADANTVTQYHDAQLNAYSSQAVALNRYLAGQGLLGSGNQMIQNADLYVGTVQQFINNVRAFADTRNSAERPILASAVASFRQSDKSYGNAQLTALGVFSGATLSDFLNSFDARIDALYDTPL